MTDAIPTPIPIESLEEYIKDILDKIKKNETLSESEKNSFETLIEKEKGSLTNWLIQQKIFDKENVDKPTGEIIMSSQIIEEIHKFLKKSEIISDKDKRLFLKLITGKEYNKETDKESDKETDKETFDNYYYINNENQNEIQNQNNKKTTKNNLISNLKTMSIFLCIFTLIWFITGLLGWLMSIYCFKYDKNRIENVIGILISTLLGPFYWLYYIYMQNYCGK